MNAVVEVFDPSTQGVNTNNVNEHIIIVGNGPAGIHLIKELVRIGYSGKISIFGEEAWEPYDRVKLSSLLNGDIDFDEVVNRPSELTSERVFQHFNCKVVAIDVDAKQVTDALGRTFEFDKLVLATGSKPHVPNIEGRDLKGVYCFRSLTDVQHLMARSIKSRRTVVVGGGLLGLEAARAMQRGNTEVVLVQHSNRVLNRQLDAAAATILHDHIAGLGIKLRLSTHVVAIQSDESAALESYAEQSNVAGVKFRRNVSRVLLSNDEELECDTVIFATGIKPNTDLAHDGNISVGMGFRVNNQLTTSHPSIFAIGECAEYNGQIWGLVAPGLQQASCLAGILGGKSTEYLGSISTSRLKVMGIDVFSMGLVGDEHEKQIDKTETYKDKDVYRKLLLKRGKIVGAILVGPCEQSAEIQRAVEQGVSILPWNIWRFRRSGSLWGENSSQSIEHWPATATVCQCKGVTVADIKAAVMETAESPAIETVAELKKATGAGNTCGSCVPLLQSYMGQSVSREKQKVSGFWLVTLMVFACVTALLSVNPLPYAGSVLDSFWWENFLRDSFTRQITGFTLIGIVVLSMLVSARKRISKFSFGNFNGWRVLHGFLGGTALAALFIHTGFDLGSNINSMLMMNFLALAVLGALTTLILSLANRLPIATNNQLRKYSTWGHIILFWPLPALLILHVLSVYFF
ncbi:MAG: FAD-dependent oxidoreductase [Pseudomonadales bacterium]|nr:FAD-dependent oxidoreductase [Pseudomonadales bacterium]